jgi:hypothetical protein
MSTPALLPEQEKRGVVVEEARRAGGPGVDILVVAKRGGCSLGVRYPSPRFREPAADINIR